MNAHDALRTDWTDIDPRNRPQPYSDAPATIPCGLLAKLQRKGGGPNQLCRDRFFSELGRELHHQEEHNVGLMLVEAPDTSGTTAGDVGGLSPSPAASTRRRNWWEREPGERKVSERMRASR